MIIGNLSSQTVTQSEVDKTCYLNSIHSLQRHVCKLAITCSPPGLELIMRRIIGNLSLQTVTQCEVDKTCILNLIHSLQRHVCRLAITCSPLVVNPLTAEDKSCKQEREWPIFRAKIYLKIHSLLILLISAALGSRLYYRCWEIFSILKPNSIISDASSGLPGPNSEYYFPADRPNSKRHSTSWWVPVALDDASSTLLVHI